ncbi:hypothetical protein CYMTET_49086 [Cymbomonas tetramitiformis]|uniref:Uncharacterized protein n=1 Tax=Cymbomonas tetramitiformis TaxID=36881 RepID=A0AAE0BS60_9CHLO|nr:hypothetical protein CYMTET_49086 [Cymbomonas tetramitiformis]
MPTISVAPKDFENVKSLESLPEKEDVWQCYVHQLRTWVSSSSNEIVRPYLMLVISVQSGAFLSTTVADEDGNTNILAQSAQPSTSQVLSFLKRVMEDPRCLNSSMASKDRKKGRPSKILFADTATAHLHRGQPDKWEKESACSYVGEARAILADVGIESNFAPVPSEMLAGIVRGQIEHAHQPEELRASLAMLPGLVQCQGFTPTFGKELFAAAKKFYSAKPWTKLPPAARRPIKVSFPIATDDEGNVYRSQGYAALIGQQQGEEESLGLALYKKEDVAWKAISSSRGDQETPAADEASMMGHSLLYFPMQEFPFEDLECAEWYGWEVQSPSAWPLFVKVAADDAENAEDDAPAQAGVWHRPLASGGIRPLRSCCYARAPELLLEGSNDSVSERTCQQRVLQ